MGIDYETRKNSNHKWKCKKNNYVLNRIKPENG